MLLLLLLVLLLLLLMLLNWPSSLLLLLLLARCTASSLWRSNLLSSGWLISLISMLLLLVSYSPLQVSLFLDGLLLPSLFLPFHDGFSQFLLFINHDPQTPRLCILFLVGSGYRCLAGDDLSEILRGLLGCLGCLLYQLTGRSNRLCWFLLLLLLRSGLWSSSLLLLDW